MSIFPMIDPGTAEINEGQALPLCREVAWDYVHDVPIFRDGVIIYE